MLEEQKALLAKAKAAHALQIENIKLGHKTEVEKLKRDHAEEVYITQTEAAEFRDRERKNVKAAGTKEFEVLRKRLLDSHSKEVQRTK